MTHDEVRSLLDAYIDDELELTTGAAVEAHLRGCNQCSAWLAERRALVGQLHVAALRYPVPGELSARIGATLRSQDRRLKIQPQWFGAIAAGLIVAIGGFLLGQFWPRAPDLRSELVTASVRAMLGPHAIDVLSSDHHTVKPWLSSQLPFSPPVPELAQQGDALLGARVDYLGSTRVAALVYQHGHHQINVYVWPRGAVAMAPSHNSAIDGYHLTATQAGEFTAVMVSDLAVGELAAFRDRWQADASAAMDAGGH
jgi:anti-sigma factor RsiW